MFQTLDDKYLVCRSRLGVWPCLPVRVTKLNGRTAHRFSTLHTAVHCKTLQCTATGQHSFSTLPMLLTAKKYFNSAQVQPTIQLVLQNTIVSSPPILHNNVQHTALLVYKIVYKSQDLK